MIEINDVIQLNPETCRNQMFAGCFIVVIEIASWGVVGYVQALGQDGKPGGQAYYRAKWEELGTSIGTAEWVVAE
jgi:hypothetical protein